MREKITLNVLGVLALAFYAIHGAHHLTRGFPANLLWCCHLGAVLVGLGLLSRRATLNGVGLCWLGVGTPLWLIGLPLGGTFVATSLLTHLGGLAIAVWGARRLGMPRGVWWKAAVGMVLLHFVTRPFNPADKNVNLAGGIWSGLEGWFPSHLVFLVTALVVCAGAFLLLERLLGRGQRADGRSI